MYVFRKNWYQQYIYQCNMLKFENTVIIVIEVYL